MTEQIKVEKEELVEKIFGWVAKEDEVGVEKAKLLKMMIEATLDYLYEHKHLDTKEEIKDGKK